MMTATKFEHLRKWNVGLVGLGKLGMPVALAMSLKGHNVMGYDIDPSRMQKQSFAAQERGPNGEPTIEPLLRESSLQFGSLSQVVEHSEIIFVAVQTPHDPKFEGVTRLSNERVDFDYTFLKQALFALSAEIEKQGQDKIVIVISTVLPGTMRRDVIPFLSPLVKLCYNPFFIAMGTTIEDFLNPEFVLFGVESKEAANWAKEFYRTLHSRPFYETTIENAELIKVAYNTWITSKICITNTLMEICHKIPGCDVDGVTNGLALATSRLWSPRYTRAGMGDGGGCHPRDNIALSWLARKLQLHGDWFENLMLCRERQTEWLADLADEQARRRNTKEIALLGKAFKPGTALTVGSPAVLLANLLAERGYTVYQYDPHTDGPCSTIPDHVSVYVVATQHDDFREWHFPAGSVVIDPFRYLPKQERAAIISIGVGDQPERAHTATERQCHVPRLLPAGIKPSDQPVWR